MRCLGVQVVSVGLLWLFAPSGCDGSPDGGHSSSDDGVAGQYSATTDLDSGVGTGGGSSTSRGGSSNLGGANVGGANATSGTMGGTTALSSTGTASSDTSTCPVWPANKIMPLVGPMFYGPDPGPCGSSSTYANGTPVTATFTYAAGQLQSIQRGDNSTTMYGWSNEILVTAVDASSGGSTVRHQYTYDPNQIVDTIVESNARVTTYKLSSTGYPLTVTFSTSTGTVGATASYEYANCRMMRRVYTDANGTPDLSQSLTYQYDAAGHVVSRRSVDDSSVDTYDYGCW